MALVLGRDLGIIIKTSQKVGEESVLGERPWIAVSTHQILMHTSVWHVGSLLQGGNCQSQPDPILGPPKPCIPIRGSLFVAWDLLVYLPTITFQYSPLVPLHRPHSLHLQWVGKWLLKQP